MTNKLQKELQLLLAAAHHDYQSGLHSRAFFKTNDQNTSQELVQNTFMKTWIYLRRGGKIDTMKAFLYHVLNNLIVDEYRKHKNISLEGLVEKGFDPTVAQTDTSRFLSFLDGKAAFLLIHKLPEKYRVILQMRYRQDLSIKQMAVLTGQSENTVSVQAHRGLQKLKILYREANPI